MPDILSVLLSLLKWDRRGQRRYERKGGEEKTKVGVIPYIGPQSSSPKPPLTITRSNGWGGGGF